MNMNRIGFAVLSSALLVTFQADATVNISSLDTGAGLYNANNGPGPVFNAVTDPNWTVSLLSTVPPGQSPPGWIPTGTAYLVPNNIGFPFGYWLPNTPTSSWITYSTPTQVGGDSTADTFQYQVQFASVSGGAADVTWLSDNSSTLYVNGQEVGTRPNPMINDPNNFTTFASWNLPVAINVLPGLNTIDLDVYNIPQGSGNPTGGRVEFTGNVSVDPVPEPTTILAGALTLLPFGASTLRILRKRSGA
jgi:hypothetical protein